MTVKPITGHVKRELLEWLLLLAVTAVSGAYLAYSEGHAYQELDAGQRERLTAQTRIIDENLVQQITAANIALQDIGKEAPVLLAQAKGTAALNRHLQIFSETMLAMRVLLVVNAQGQITAANDEKLLGASVAQRAYFALAANRNNPQTLYLEPPLAQRFKRLHNRHRHLLQQCATV